MSGSPPERYSEAEVALLLGRAIELERRLPGPGERTGVSLSDLRQIGAEVGIPGAILDEAAQQVAMEKTGLWERIIRTRTRFYDERVVSGELTAGQVARLIGVLRRITRRQGTVDQVLGAVEWKKDSEFSPLHVRVHTGGGRTRIEALENRRGESALSIGFGGPFLGGVVGLVAAVMLGVAGPSAGVGAGVGALAGTVGSWLWWRWILRRAGDRLDHLMASLGAEATRMVHGDPDDRDRAGSGDSP